MGNIKIIKGVFDTKLELEHAGITAGFPSPADEYRHETLDFNRDYIRHPEERQGKGRSLCQCHQARF